METITAKIVEQNDCKGGYSNSNIKIELNNITFHYFIFDIIICRCVTISYPYFNVISAYWIIFKFSCLFPTNISFIILMKYDFDTHSNFNFNWTRWPGIG